MKLAHDMIVVLHSSHFIAHICRLFRAREYVQNKLKNGKVQTKEPTPKLYGWNKESICTL